MCCLDYGIQMCDPCRQIIERCSLFAAIQSCVDYDTTPLSKKRYCFCTTGRRPTALLLTPPHPLEYNVDAMHLLFEVFGSTSNRSSTLYLRGAGGETSCRTAIPFFGQGCPINSQVDYNEEVLLQLRCILLRKT